MSSSPTHILYIAEFSTGGSVESLLCLVGGLDKANFKATVLFYEMPDEVTCTRFESTGATVHSLYARSSGKGGPNELRQYNLQAKIRTILGRRIERYYESLKYALYFLRFRLSIFNAIRRQINLIQPDLVHLNNGVGSDTPGISAARTCNIPTVCHIRTFARLTHINIAAARLVSVFLCISNAVREQVIGQGLEPDRCIVVPNAVDPQRFNNVGASSAGIHTEFGWDSSHKIFALVGRVISWKGQDVFIQAIAEARKSDASIRGLIVGEGEPSAKNEEYLARLRSLVSALALKDIVKFTGHRTDIPEIMKSADGVICASSLPEPFGRVIIEGMAVGKPVVATNAGGAPDIITDGVNGLLVPTSDSNALANAILRLSHDRAFAEKLRSAGTLTVEDRYTVSRHVNQVCDIYNSVLETREIE